MTTKTRSPLGAVAGGVHSARVLDVADPEGLGRVRIELSGLAANDGDAYSAWARLAVPLAGPERGTWFVPEVDDEVLVAFEGGDARRPVVLGSMWNGADEPPESADAANDRKVIRTRSGLTLSFDDAEGAESIVLETPGGRRLTLRDDEEAVVIEDGSGSSLRMDVAGIQLRSTARVVVHAAVVEVSASLLDVEAAVARFSGVVQADSVVTNSVIASSYTPGAGNIW